MKRAYERLIEYAKVHTTSDEESGTHPSFKGEFDLANILCEELTKIGMKDARVDEHCYVYAYLPANEKRYSVRRTGIRQAAVCRSGMRFSRSRRLPQRCS